MTGQEFTLEMWLECVRQSFAPDAVIRESVPGVFGHRRVAYHKMGMAIHMFDPEVMLAMMQHNPHLLAQTERKVFYGEHENVALAFCELVYAEIAKEKASAAKYNEQFDAKMTDKIHDRFAIKVGELSADLNRIFMLTDGGLVEEPKEKAESLNSIRLRGLISEHAHPEHFVKIAGKVEESSQKVIGDLMANLDVVHMKHRDRCEGSIVRDNFKFTPFPEKITWPDPQLLRDVVLTVRKPQPTEIVELNDCFDKILRNAERRRKDRDSNLLRMEAAKLPPMPQGL